MNIEDILNVIYTSQLLNSEDLHTLTEWICDKDKEIERLNNIINEMEQFFIDNANDEMKKCFDKLHSLKGSDKE